MPVLIAIGVVSILAAMSLVSSITAGIQNRKMIKRLNRIEGFYSGELLAWHVAERVRAGLNVSGDSVPFNVDYAASFSGVEEGGDGMSYNIIQTRRHSPSKNLLRRYDPARFIAQVGDNSANCGKVGFKGSKNFYRVCLAQSGARSTKSMVHLAYFAMDGGIGINLARILDNGELDSSFGTEGIVRIRGMFGGANFKPRPSFVSRSDGSLLFMVEGGLLAIRPDGTVDTTFGTNGIVELPFDIEEKSARFTYYSDFLGPDNSLFVPKGGLPGVAFLSTRGNGSTNLNYGDNGWFTLDLCSEVPDLCPVGGPYLTTNMPGIIRHPGGSYLMIENARELNINIVSPRILNVGLDGRFVSSFGDNGAVKIPKDYRPLKITRLEDGKILMLAKHFRVNSSGAAENFELTFFRFLADGSPDPQFGTNGLVAHPFVGGSYYFDRKSRLVISREELSSNKRLIKYSRYLPDGTLDVSFGIAGIANIAEFPESGYCFTSSNLQFGEDGSILSDIIYEGGMCSAPGAAKKIFLHHLRNDGTPDPYFGNAGMVEVTLPGAIVSANTADFIR